MEKIKVTYRVEECELVYFDEEVSPPILVVPPVLEEKAKAFLSLPRHWTEVWDHFKEDGLKHPWHGTWYQKDMVEEGVCGAYWMGAPSAYFMGVTMCVCKLEGGHVPPHSDGEYKWTDEQADEANDRQWRRWARAWAEE